MDDQGYSNSNEPLGERAIHTLEGYWPTIYGWINALFFGAITFVKFILRGFWPGK